MSPHQNTPPLPIDTPSPVRSGEELDVQRLKRYLRDRLPASDAPLQVMQFPSGYSNLTYAVSLGRQELVLRRPPFGNEVKSAHDMAREYHVLRQLSRVYPPAPQPVLYCDDPAILGDTFYLVERRKGVILRGPHSPPLLAGQPTVVADVCKALVTQLARLHQVDYQAIGLADLGKPRGYVGRQVTGWTDRYGRAATDTVVAMDEVAQWLHDHQPTESRAALIHNDFKYDNVILDVDDPTHVVAVLDWEMATIGDPLMDLGSALAYWVEASDPELLQRQAFGPTAIEGSCTRAEFVDAYAAATGWDIPNRLFYYVFGLYKLAVIVQQIYSRYVRGATQDSRFARLDRLVATLADTAAAAIARDRL